MLEELKRSVEEFVPESKTGEEKKKPEGRWALFTAVGSFFLYLFGYLSLRFHLSTFGVDTDLAVLDERYLFAGAQFLVYFLCSIPIALPCLCLLRLFARRIPAVKRWLSRPDRALIAGFVLSVALIQVVIRQCLPFINLLLRDHLPEPEFMQALLLDESGALQSLYFSGLVAAVLALAALLWIANRQAIRPSSFWNGALAFLVAIQFLMLPVTFGVLIVNKGVPRVTSLNGKEQLKPGEEAWRIWEGKDGVTFFVRRWEQGAAKRMLVTLNKKSIEKTEIAGYDQVLKLLY